MSNIRLNTPNDIELFLRILAEESVKEAQVSISNSDPMQDKIITQMKSDKSVYNISEQPVAGDQDIVTAEDEPEEGEATQPVQPPHEEEELESEVSPDVGYSLDSIRDSIKNLRSGLSVDDSAMKAEIGAYFDRLSGPERQALQVYFDSFSKILTRAVSGAEAQDPSDPPTSISMSGPSEEPEPSPEAETAPPSEPSEVGEEWEEEPEDVGTGRPPIRVGEHQRMSEIRKRVRSLMSR